MISECSTQIMREVSQRMKIICYKNEICKYLQCNFGVMRAHARARARTYTHVRARLCVRAYPYAQIRNILVCPT
jgi:hypothetical protein